ncbi:hypothetical protein [Methylobacter svalbardensis]|uniref:hypothetical protein n=1 Tax=Methylobacter svalbardensis TaxID=3080016 RepID=UPI0030EB486A
MTNKKNKSESSKINENYSTEDLKERSSGNKSTPTFDSARGRAGSVVTTVMNTLPSPPIPKK